MIINSKDIDAFDKVYRLNLINSITGIKPANLIGTKSKEGLDNVAIFTSVVHLGSKPSLLGMVSRPQDPGIKDTYANITDTGYYTINHISKDFIKKAHYTSAKLDKTTSEFDIMHLEREFQSNFYAPFVKESHFKVGIKFKETIDLPNGCILIIGEVVLIDLPDNCINEIGGIDLSAYDAVGISGLDSYYELNKIAQFPYVKADEIPDFSKV